MDRHVLLTLTSASILLLGCSSSPGRKEAIPLGDGNLYRASPIDSSSKSEAIHDVPLSAGTVGYAGSTKKRGRKSRKKARRNKPRNTGDHWAPQRSVTNEKRLPATRTLYLSADDSNSQASPVVARNRILQGRFVDAKSVRAYEFLNYYTFLYPPAERDSVAIYPELRARGARSYTLQVAARSEDRARRDVLPLNFTFLIDTSGSMAGRPTELVREFINKFTGVLKKGDRFSVVICSSLASVVVDSFVYDKDRIDSIREKIQAAVKANDATDLSQGIQVAYQLAEKNYANEFLNRVIILSDGATNAGNLAIQSIKKHAADSERRGIYLVGVGFGEGFNDTLMNAVTDAGKGAYFFVSNEQDIEKALERDFAANFDIAVKDVRMKMVMPTNWIMTQFHGEQVSTVKSEVIPQHLAPNDQMIYHQVLSASHMTPDQEFVFEVEFRDAVTNKLKKVVLRRTVQQMLGAPSRQVSKGDAICAYADMFKKMKVPLESNTDQNLVAFDQSMREFRAAANEKPDSELDNIAKLMNRYRLILEQGQIFPKAHDKISEDIIDVLGLDRSVVKKCETRGEYPRTAIKAFKRLNNSSELVPREGYRFLMLSNGRAGAPRTKGGFSISPRQDLDPRPQFMGSRRLPKGPRIRIQDCYQITLILKAPAWAKSFSFDFNFFSAEYPEYVDRNYNDTFYAIIEAASTNKSAKTNIAFDARGQSIEVDNNYFENDYHPLSNRGTGFHDGGSTSWLRTSWPIKGGEGFKITFSVHDEGDGVYDSAVLLDNFKFHRHESVGNTDPLN
ncbi:MAG: VWA domain-containing protein [Planctomycetota bacterium]|nr:VWA domain-containing protein [Planctomycetota bacterium]